MAFIRQLQNISEPIAALHLCAVERCMWRFHVVYGCTTEGDLNFEATRVATPSPPVVVNSTGRGLHWRFGGRMFCAVLCHLPFESHQQIAVCHGNCRNMSEFTPWSVRLPISVRVGFPLERFWNDALICCDDTPSLWRQMASCVFLFAFFHHSIVSRADPFWRFQWGMLPPARFKSVGCLALDFKPPRCFKTLQLCWDDIRWFLILKWAVKSKQIPSSVLTFRCLDSWTVFSISPGDSWSVCGALHWGSDAAADTKVASKTLELPKLRHSADAAGGRAGNADWN